MRWRTAEPAWPSSSSCSGLTRMTAVFLLIIFFMVGTKFVEMERKMAVKVPEVSDVAALTPAPQKRVINVYRDGTIALDDRPLTIDELESDAGWSASIGHLLAHLDNRMEHLQRLICNMLAKREQWLRHVADPRHPSIDRASLEAAREAGVDIKLHEYEHDPANARYGLEAGVRARGRYVDAAPLANRFDDTNNDSDLRVELRKRLYDFGQTRASAAAADAYSDSAR